MSIYYRHLIENGYLLDIYPNAAAAYSLRKLRSAYTGSAIRVRRSNDNTEQDFGFDSNGNLDVTSLLSFCGVNNGFITTWYDQSVNGLNYTQSTASLQPRIVSSGSIILEGSTPAISFNNNLFRSNLLLTQSTNLAMFQVLRINTLGATNPRYAAFNNSASSINIQYGIVSAFNRYFVRRGGVTRGTDTTYSVTNTRYLITNGVSSNTNYFARNGVTSTMNNVPSVAADSLLGNGQFILDGYNSSVDVKINTGTIQEVIIYDFDQLSNQLGIANKINEYYGIY